MAVLSAMLSSSCSRNKTSTVAESGKQYATVTMRDGTTTTGTVVKNSGAEITIAGDDNITRTIPMSQVRAIEYNDTAAGPSAVPSNTPAANPAVAGDQTQSAPPSNPPAPQPMYEVPAGTRVAVRTEEAIDSASAAEGQAFAGEITQDVLDSGGEVAVPRGSSTQIVIRSASKGGRIRGEADLVLDLKSVTIGGRPYGIETRDIVEHGKEGIGENRRTAEFGGGGAALGMIIGAIAGGGKGAALGTVSGAGAGAATEVLTKGKSIRIPAETLLTFKLDRPLRVTAQP
jgi:hypothetical protein